MLKVVHPAVLNTDQFSLPVFLVGVLIKSEFI